MSIFHKPGERPFVIGCGVFGGRSKKTGKKVGERHRWPNGWGQGRCEFCGRYLEEVMSRPEPRDPTVHEVVDRCVGAEVTHASAGVRGWAMDEPDGAHGTSGGPQK